MYQRTTVAGDNAWGPYTPAIIDLTNGWYTFTVDQLSGFDYALAAVPEPLRVCGGGGFGRVGLRRNCRRPRRADS